MYIVAAHNWKQTESETAEAIANTMDILVFEARQKISNGGPSTLTSFAQAAQAEELANRLDQVGIPALVINPRTTRKTQPLHVSHFVIGENSLQLQTDDGGEHTIDFGAIELLLVAIGNAGLNQTTAITTERKFSLGKTLLAVGIPMTKKVESEKIVTVVERDKTLWLYTRGQTPFVFNRATLSYKGLGAAMQLTRTLNFNYLKTVLRRIASQAIYDDRLLRRAEQINMLGPTLDPDVDLDLAFEILSRSLRHTDSRLTSHQPA